MLCVFGHEAVNSVMGEEGTASEKMLATVTALVSPDLFAPDKLLT